MPHIHIGFFLVLALASTLLACGDNRVLEEDTDRSAIRCSLAGGDNGNQPPRVVIGDADSHAAVYSDTYWWQRNT